MKRRKFIQRVASTGIVLPIAFGFPRLRAFGQSPKGSPFTRLMAAENDHIFVIIRLAGGNDGLNNVIPYANDLYYNARFAGTADDLSIPANQVVKLPDSDTMGLHPSFQPLLDLYGEGKMTLVQNVAYPGQNLSHFRSTDIWLSGSDANVFDDAGWYAKYLEAKYPDYPEVLPASPFAIEFGNFLSTTLIGEENNMGIAVGNLDYIPGLPGNDDIASTKAGEEEAYVREVIRQSNIFSNAVLAAYVGGTDNSGHYTNASGTLGQGLAAVARMIQGGLGTRMYILNVGGYDTHTNQLTTHANLLSQLANAIKEFQRDLETLGLADRVCAGTISEFGRRVQSNGTGTDHGEAAPAFFFGHGVNGGIIGTDPNLSDLTGPGNLKMEYDFRQLYASILGQWYEATDSELAPALPHTFEQLPIFKVSGSSVTDTDALAAGFTIGQNAPNPARSRVSIPVGGVKSGMNARFSLYTVEGRELLAQPVNPGQTSVEVDV
ncbi:MAG: DUF1501 domain-containing protein, partial [Candidatus Kapaibacterium sp.]